MNLLPIIELQNVTKKFVLYRDKPRDLKKYLVSLFQFNKGSETIETAILEDISLKIFPGEFVGIMGRNGVGKSTTLKIISGIYSPSSGAVHIHGRIAPVLELGAGFADELSGYDNIFLNASILGSTESECRSKINDIINFSELGENIYAPVRNYSSGMLVRLAFAIACHLDSDILIFDEVLAVGDLGFQKKCLDKIDELHRQGKTIILVTHSPNQVKEHCKRCILLDERKVVYDGDPKIGADLYIKKFN